MEKTLLRQQSATLRYLDIAPRKVRLLADTLKGLSVQEAEAQLLLRTQRSRLPLLKLLRSAVANAKTNAKLKTDQLVISSIHVDGGPILKRFLPRAQGRATPIHKKLSHVTLTLTEKETAPLARFTIVPPPTKQEREKAANKKTKAPKESKPTNEGAEKMKQQDKVGVFKRMFRRKSV
jgi:large subunit ribosomal protein L22